MEFLIHKGTKYVETGIKCPRCDYDIVRETYINDNKPTDHFACTRMGCTYPSYSENKLELIQKDMDRVTY